MTANVKGSIENVQEAKRVLESISNNLAGSLDAFPTDVEIRVGALDCRSVIWNCVREVAAYITAAQGHVDALMTAAIEEVNN